MENNSLTGFQKYKYHPIIISVIYYLATVIIFEFGPIDWKIDNNFQFYFYIFSYLIMFILGYLVAIKTKVRVDNWNEANENYVLRFLSIFIPINFMVFIINLFREFGLNSFDFRALISNLSAGLTHIGQGYFLRLQRISSIQGNQVLGVKIMSAFNYGWYFFSLFIILLGFIYIKKLKIINKIVLILNVGLIILMYISIGTNIGVFRLIWACLIFFTLYKIRLGEQKKKYSKFLNIKVLSVAIIIILMYFFMQTMNARGGILSWDSPTYNVGGVPLDKDSIFFKFVPSALIPLLISGSSYLSQGYYGFALSLKLDWIPMFGLGSSMELVDAISKLGIDINKYTYQFRIQEAFGWDSRVQWASLFTWLGNDVSFFGVILVMFVIGYIFALSYKDSLTTKNPFSMIIFYFFTIIVIFIPANNQIVQDFYTLLPFVLTLLLWGRSRSNNSWMLKIW